MEKFTTKTLKADPCVVVGMLVVLGLLWVGVGHVAAADKPEKIVIEIEGMTCQSCANAVQRTLAKLPGVKSVTVSLEDKSALVVSGAEEPTDEALKAAVEKAGGAFHKFKAVSITSSTAAAAEKRINIEGMTCEDCASAVQKNLAKLKGVKTAKVSIKDKSALVTVDGAEEPNNEALKKAVQDAGFKALSVQPTPDSGASRSGSDAKGAFDPKIAAACQRFCATRLPFEESQLVRQPGAKAGDLSRCPVSGVVIVSKQPGPEILHENKTYYLCCDGCAKLFQANPAQFVVKS